MLLASASMNYALVDDAVWCRLDRDLGAAQTEELRALAASSLRTLLDGLEFASAHGARGDLRRGAERLAGTAAMAGLPALTQAARALERAAKCGEGTDAVMKPVRTLGQRSLDALSLGQPWLAQPASTPTSL